MSAALDRARDFLQGRIRGPLVSFPHQPDYRQNPDPEAMVASACEIILKDMTSGEPDVVPSFFADFGTVSTAALFGGKRIPARDGGAIHIEAVAQSVDDLLNLTPCAFEDSDYQLALDLYRKVCDRLETDDLFIRTPDFQGPLNTLALLIDQTEMMVAMIERPDDIKMVLDRITRTLIDYTGAFREAIGPAKVIGNIWPFIILPDGKGVGITQDYLPLLGPEQYAEFELPLLKRISDHFGGVYIHCCGKYGQHLPILASSGLKIWGLEFHYPETRVEDMFETFGDTVAFTPYVAPTGQQEFPTLAAMVRSWRGKPHLKGRYWFCWCPEWGHSEDLRQAIDEVFS